MRRTVYSLLQEPVAAAYRALVTFCSRHASEIIVVVRQPEYLDVTAQNAIKALERVGASCARESKWAGTTLTRGDLAYVYRVPVASESVQLLTIAVDRLYGWLTPKMPEDLCFLRSDGTDILATISHERDAYLTLSDDEYVELQADPFLSSLSMQPLDDYCNPSTAARR